MSWQHLDNQMARWTVRLTTEVGVAPNAATKLATTITADVRFLDYDAKEKIRKASPVPLKDRLDGLGWLRH
jgi:hypothetical protein